MMISIEDEERWFGKGDRKDFLNPPMELKRTSAWVFVLKGHFKTNIVVCMYVAWIQNREAGMIGHRRNPLGRITQETDGEEVKQTNPIVESFTVPTSNRSKAVT